jgi:hypothetical protein
MISSMGTPWFHMEWANRTGVAAPASFSMACALEAAFASSW